MTIRSRLLSLVFCLLGLSLLSQAQGFGDNGVFLKPQDVFHPVVSTQGNAVTVQWQIADGYYLYRHGFEVNVGEGASKAAIEFAIEPGVVKYDENFEKNVEVYRGSVETAFTIDSALAALAKTQTLSLTTQGCADEGFCYPPTAYPFQLSFDDAGQLKSVLPVKKVKQKSGFLSTLSNNGASSSASNSGVESVAGTESKIEPLSFMGFLLTLLSALIGGFILNAMPCVFPVLSLKAMSFASGHSTPSQQRLHGWVYTLGVVSSFLAVAAMILVAKSLGTSLGWGFQLQEPLFVVAMIYLFFLMALSLSGFVEFGRSIMGVGQSLTQGTTLSSSFFTGVLAVVVASPCTAPFMATAIGVAFTQPAAITLSIFLALGFGMALPFLALSYSSKIADKMPRPGAWMETFKQAIAFPLYLSVIWLLWVLGNQTNQTVLFIALLSLLFVIFGLWLAKLTALRPVMRVIKKGFIVLSLVPSLWLVTSLDSKAPVVSADQTFTMQKLDDLRDEGVPVFVDLTADWCLSCKVNEKIALTPATKANFKAQGIQLLIGDWTQANPEVEALLNRYNRSGIPLYLMYPKGKGEAEILPQILTPGIIRDAVARATL